MIKTDVRTYDDIIILDSFKERFDYLKLGGKVGEKTFGFDRFINQRFYRSPEWKRIRQEVIIRDYGCDLGIRDRQIDGLILIHHMNPITVNQIKKLDLSILDPKYLISVSFETHQAIHYSSKYFLSDLDKTRRPGDTKLW